jgi:hypothetical protein
MHDVARSLTVPKFARKWKLFKEKVLHPDWKTEKPNAWTLRVSRACTPWTDTKSARIEAIGGEI